MAVWCSYTHSMGLASNSQVLHVLSAVPLALPSDPDERSRLLALRMRKGDPSTLAEIVRDLTWHQRKGLANTKDLRLLRQATVALSAKLAAYKGMEPARARGRIREVVERTVSLFI